MAITQMTRFKSDNAEGMIKNGLRPIARRVADGGPSARRFDALRLLRQAPAVTEPSLLDTEGKEFYKASRSHGRGWQRY